MPDKNLYSFTGDAAGNIWLNNELIFVAFPPGVVPFMREHALPAVVVPSSGSISDALKLSGTRWLLVSVGTLDARWAVEDAIDINHCEDSAVHIGTLYPGKRYCGTIKGASRRIRITVDDQRGHGGETDWDLGNFADQGNAPTTGIALNITTRDRSPVRVRLLSASRPECENDSCQPYVIDARARGWFYPVYNFFKDLLATFRIKI